MRIASKTYSSRSNVVRMTTRDAARSGSAAICAGGLEPVQPGHPDVHEHDVGAGRADERDGLVAVRGLPDDLDVVLGIEQRTQPGPQQRLVVGQHDPDHCGAPGGRGRHARPAAAARGRRRRRPDVPPSATARSRMPRMPLPSSSAPMRAAPVPSSSTSTVSTSAP